MNSPTQLSPADKAQIRARSRQRILQKREEALLCRRQYDEQLEMRGEIGRELHADLAVAAMRLRDTLYVYRDEDVLDGDFPDVEELSREMYQSNQHVAENPNTPAKRFAELIDQLDGVTHKLGFVPEVEK